MTRFLNQNWQKGHGAAMEKITLGLIRHTHLRSKALYSNTKNLSRRKPVEPGKPVQAFWHRRDQQGEVEHSEKGEH